MKRRIMSIVALALAVAGVVSLSPQPAMALGGGNCGAPEFLGFKPWYAGLCDPRTDEIQSPTKGSTDDLQAFIWTIVLNISFDLSLAVGILAVGFIIYGGYLYIMSQGDPSRAVKGKKTLAAAIIGTVVAMAANLLVNTARVILLINTTDGWKQGEINSRGQTMIDEQVTSIFTWAYTISGIVAVAFIIRGAIEYMTSQGDPSRVSKATRSIIYAVVGLVIVIFAAAITLFVTGAVGEGMK